MYGDIFNLQNVFPTQRFHPCRRPGEGRKFVSTISVSFSVSRILWNSISPLTQSARHSPLWRPIQWSSQSKAALFSICSHTSLHTYMFAFFCVCIFCILMFEFRGCCRNIKITHKRAFARSWQKYQNTKYNIAKKTGWCKKQRHFRLSALG